MRKIKLLLLRRYMVVLMFACVSFFFFQGSGSAFSIDGRKWGTPGLGNPGGTVTWSLMGTGVNLNPIDSGGPSTALSAFMPAGFKTEIESAFDAWSSVADITFSEVADNGENFGVFGGSGDIRIGGHVFDGAGGILAHGYYPPNNSLSGAGDIHFDENDQWKIGFGGSGFDIFTVMAHEIGHAIGLDHDTEFLALMNPFYSEAFSGLRADDIAGAQAIYGSAPVAAVPEPSTVALLGIGILGMLGYSWRKRKFVSVS